MALRNSTPLKFQARGLSDTLDGSNVFAGAMNQLVNLIPDPTTEGQWVCRPAVKVLLVAAGSPWSSGFSSGFGPTTSGVGVGGNVTALIAVGHIVYGMYSSGGHDLPFGYNLDTSTLLSVSGATTSNTPITLSTSGEWVPPTMTLVGTKIVVCHQGFVPPNFVGYIDISSPLAPAWTAGNLTGAVPFTTPPTACGQFNQRAYYLVNPATGQPSAIFSDVLVPQNVTNANQVLTFGDSLKLTAAIGLPLNSSTQGGIIQSLLVFKGTNKIHQITGDAANTPANLVINELNVATGTAAPNTIKATHKGVMFMSPDGLRLIDFYATVSDPIGINGGGVSVPFIAALEPSRAVAAFGSDVYRITVHNGYTSGSPVQEFWLDFASQRWTGPHSLHYSQIVAVANSFVGQQIGGEGQLVKSDVIQTPTSTFIEVTPPGSLVPTAPMQFQWLTSMLPDTDQMNENAMVETTVFLSLNPGDIYTVVSQNQNGSAFDTINNLAATGTATVWGQFQWGQALWGGAQTGIAPHQIAWHYPIVFRRLAVAVAGHSSLAFRVGNMHLRYEKLGYLQQTLIGT